MINKVDFKALNLTVNAGIFLMFIMRNMGIISKKQSTI